MKLQLIGQPSCRPCVQLKNEINERIEELAAISVDFEYVDLNELSDKDTFIQKHNLNATPTIMIVEGEQEIKRMTGYMTVDTIIGTLKELQK